MRAVRIVIATAVLFISMAGAAPAARAPTVFAAASLTEVFPKIDPSARYSIAGSNTLRLQIIQGAPADVFASAAPNYTHDLYTKGLVEKPRLLAFNRLTLIVPKGNPAHVGSVYDINRGGIKLVVANSRVPAGAYTRRILANLGLSSALKNVVSQESDVKGVVGKVALGEADAGLVYATDALAASKQLKQIAIPTFAQPKVRYEIAVVASSSHKAAARAFVAKATGPGGRRALAAAGFTFPVPPKPKPEEKARAKAGR